MESRVCRIVSLIKNQPAVGVNYTKQGYQVCYLDDPVNQWVFRKVAENRFRLSLGGYVYTGTVDGRATVSIHSEHDTEWIITHREDQQAYTIEQPESGNGWTVDSETSQITISPIVSTRSLPPQFLPDQLFKFEPVDGKVLRSTNPEDF